MKLSHIENVMIDAMARAFWVSAWADRQENKQIKCTQRTFPGCGCKGWHNAGTPSSWQGRDLMDLAPKTPRYARDFALMFAGGIRSIGSRSLMVVLDQAARADTLEAHKLTSADVPLWCMRPELEAEKDALKTEAYARDLGHYLAMMGMGHGVSWFDDHAKFDVQVPRVEAIL